MFQFKCGNELVDKGNTYAESQTPNTSKKIETIENLLVLELNWDSCWELLFYETVKNLDAEFSMDKDRTCSFVRSSKT